MKKFLIALWSMIFTLVLILPIILVEREDHFILKIFGGFCAVFISTYVYYKLYKDLTECLN